jgi:hypothetical protein
MRGAGRGQFILLRRLRRQSVCDFGAGDFRRSLGLVPKPSDELDHLAKEYKGRSGALGSTSKSDDFGKELRSAKPLFVSSILTRASNNLGRKSL